MLGDPVVELGGTRGAALEREAQARARPALRRERFKADLTERHRLVGHRLAFAANQYLSDGLALPAATPDTMVNLVVQYQQIDRSFAALADPTRRAVLERLGRGSATISELAAPFEISLTGMKKHVRVLEDVALVSTEKVGRTRRCRLGPQRLDAAQEWMEDYRRMLDERLDRFGELLERTKGGS